MSFEWNRLNIEIWWDMQFSGNHFCGWKFDLKTWRNCPSRADSEYRWIGHLQFLLVPTWFSRDSTWFSRFLRHTRGIHLDPWRFVSQELGETGHIHGITEITENSKREPREPREPVKKHGHPAKTQGQIWNWEQRRHTQISAMDRPYFISFLRLFASSCYAFCALADFWVAHQYDWFDGLILLFSF